MHPPSKKESRGFFPRTLIRIFKSPWAPAIVALIGAMAGLSASLHTKDLKTALLSLQTGQLSAITGNAWFTIGFFSVFFLFYAGQQYANQWQASDAKAELFAETNKLAVSIARMDSLPPAGFLLKFQDLYRISADLGRLPVQGPDTKETIELYIRSVLKSIAALAYQFRKAPDGQPYSANLMLCKTQTQIQALSNEQRDEIEHRLLFCPDLPSPKLKHTTTVLDLIPQMCSDYEPSAQSSLQTPSIALPVFHAQEIDLGAESGHKFKVLPGAPFAASTHRYAAFESVKNLLTWCRDNADFTAATISEIQSYFENGSGRQIKSFISVPICMIANEGLSPLPFGGLAAKNGDQEEYCLAVLNIHSQGENILGEDGYSLFVPILEPFLNILSHLLEAYGNKPSSQLTAGATLKP